MQLYLLNTRREKSKAHRTDQCTNFKSETIYLPTILANHFLNGTTGQLLIKESEFASVLVSRALICLVVNKTLIPSSWTTPMDYSYGQPLKWTTLLWFGDFPLYPSIFFFPRKFFTRPLLSEPLEQPNIFFSRSKNVPFIHF